MTRSFIVKAKRRSSVEMAMQHNDSYSDNTYGFVNNITTPEGGNSY